MACGNWVGKKADTSKKPLLGYEEWAAKDMGLWEEERVRNVMGDQENEEEDTPRWINWEQMCITEQWKWLAELGAYPGEDRCVHALRSWGYPKQKEKKDPLQEQR